MGTEDAEHAPEYKKYIDSGLEWGLILIFFSFPLPTAWVNISFLVAALFLLLSIFFVKDDTKRLKNIPQLFLPLVFYIGAHLIAAVLGVDPLTSLVKARSLRRILFAYLMYSALGRTRTVKRMLIAFGGAAVLDCAYGFFAVGGMPEVRVKGFSPHPNMMASIIACILTYNIVFLLFYPLSKRHKVALSMSGIILSAGLVMTQSRGVLVGFVFSIVLVSLYVNWKKALFFGLTCAFFFVVEPSYLQERQLSSFDPRTDGGRSVIWKSTLKIIRDYPFGVGQWNFPTMFLHYAEKEIEAGKTEAHTQAHNNLLNIQAELGFVGLLSYLWVWKRILVYCWKKIAFLEGDEDRRFEQVFLVATLSYFLIFHVAGLFDVNWGFHETSIAIWSLVGIMFWIGERGKA